MSVRNIVLPFFSLKKYLLTHSSLHLVAVVALAISLHTKWFYNINFFSHRNVYGTDEDLLTSTMQNTNASNDKRAHKHTM